jgi:hypothetical protein
MTAYDDTYLTILDVDGTEWADQLRFRMHDPLVGDQPIQESKVPSFCVVKNCKCILLLVAGMNTRYHSLVV